METSGGATRSLEHLAIHPSGEPAFPAGQAFSLGWNLCRLYLSGTAPRRQRHSPMPDRLPSPGRLTEAERSLIRLGQVRATIDSLDSCMTTNGQAPLRAAVNRHIEELEPDEDGGADCPDPKASLCEAHLALAHALSSSDARLAKAYQLGISLASTCYAPTDGASLRREFNRHRMRNSASGLPTSAHCFQPMPVGLCACRAPRGVSGFSTRA